MTRPQGSKWGFRLMVFIGPSSSLTAPVDTCVWDVGPPIGTVEVAGPRVGAPGNRDRLVFTGRSYPSQDVAQSAGVRLKDLIRRAATEIGCAVDVGNDRVLGGAGDTVIKAAANEGVQLLQDVHGLVVFQETAPSVRTLSLTATARITQPLSVLLDAARAATTEPESTPKQKLAMDLYTQSNVESSERSRFLTLVTALEVLSERQPREGIASQLIEQFIADVVERQQAARAAGKKTEADELYSLLGALRDLRTESISKAIRSLVASLDSSVDGAAVGRMYTVRGRLVHAGQVNDDVGAYISQLESLVRKASLRINK